MTPERSAARRRRLRPGRCRRLPGEDSTVGAAAAPSSARTPSGAGPHPAKRASSGSRSSCRLARTPCHILALSQTVGGDGRARRVSVTQAAGPRARRVSVGRKEVRRMRKRGLMGRSSRLPLRSRWLPARPPARLRRHRRPKFGRPDLGDLLARRRRGHDEHLGGGAGSERRVEPHVRGRRTGRRDGSVDEAVGRALSRGGRHGPGAVHSGPTSP